MTRAIVGDGAAAELGLLPAFGGDARVEFVGRHRGGVDPARLIVEPPERREPVAFAQLRAIDGALEHRDGLVVDLQRHRERMAVLAAVREREARRVGEAAGRAVHDLGHQREREQRPRAHAGHQHQLGEVVRARGRRPRPASSRGAADRCPRRARRDARAARSRARPPIAVSGPPRASPIISARAAAGAVVDEVDDVARRAPFDRRVRLVDERAGAVPDPVIAPRLPARAVHPLLHDHPGPVVGDDEAVQVSSKPSCTAALSTFATRRLARTSAGASRPTLVAERGQLVGRAARVAPAAAAHVQAELALDGREAALERADHAGRDARTSASPSPSRRRTTGTRTGSTAGAAPRSRPYSCAIASTITRPSRAMRDASQAGTRPPCSGRSAVPVRPAAMRRAWHGRTRQLFALAGRSARTR